MPAICTGANSPNACGHYNLSVNLDGSNVSLHVHDSELLEPLTDDEKRLLVLLTARRLRQHKNVPLPAFFNKVLLGEEATNVKTYSLVPPGSIITKTNIGTQWSNVLPGANGQRVLVDFTACTEFMLVVTANLVGSGPFGFRVVRDSDSAVLYQNDSIALSGERELDTGWLPIPLAAMEQEVVRFEAKSGTAQDDPIIRRCQLLVR